MASLGQLTAGIAHEIKNPLNFVNNFASLSIELLDEFKDTARPAMAALGADKRAEIEEVTEMLTSNLEKIVEHGQRADGIVRSMLAHSRGSSGERQSTDINGLVEDALNLHFTVPAPGIRASTSPWNASSIGRSRRSSWSHKTSPGSFSTCSRMAFMPPTNAAARRRTRRSGRC